MRATTAAAYLITASVISGCSEDPTSPPDGGTLLPDAQGDAGFMAPAEVCPRGNALPIFADINGDGVVDVADPIALQSYLFRGGTEPACAAAADFNDDGRIELDDSHRITTYLVTGAQQPRTLDPIDCESPSVWPEGTCTPLGFVFVGPSRVTEGRFTTNLSIQGPTSRAQGWSLSLSATDCSIAGVTTDDTSAAEIFDSPPGIRHLGYSASTTVENGAVSYVILSFNEDILLPASAEPIAVLTVDLQASPPASGCRPCTVAIGAPLVWEGQPIEAVIVAENRSYRPPPASTTIEVCAP